MGLSSRSLTRSRSHIKDDCSSVMHVCDFRVRREGIRYHACINALYSTRLADSSATHAR